MKSHIESEVQSSDIVWSPAKLNSIFIIIFTENKTKYVSSTVVFCDLMCVSIFHGNMNIVQTMCAMFHKPVVGKGFILHTWWNWWWIEKQQHWILAFFRSHFIPSILFYIISIYESTSISQIRWGLIYRLFCELTMIVFHDGIFFWRRTKLKDSSQRFGPFNFWNTRLNSDAIVMTFDLSKKWVCIWIWIQTHFSRIQMGSSNFNSLFFSLHHFDQPWIKMLG